MKVFFLICFAVGSSVGMSFLTIEHHEMKFDENVMNVETSIKKRGDKYVINIKGELFEDVTEPIYVHSSIYERGDDGEYKHLMNASVNACSILQRMKSRPLIRAVMKEIMRTSNIPLECPYKQGSYYMNDFVLDDSLIPAFVQPFIPPGNFMSIMRISRVVDDMDMTLIRMKCIIDIDPKKGKSMKLFNF